MIDPLNIPREGKHALDEIAVPVRRIGQGKVVDQTIWMQLWPELTEELNRLNAVMLGEASFDAESFPRLAVVLEGPVDAEAAVAQLRTFAQSFLKPLADDAHERLPAADPGLHGVLGWQVFLTGATLRDVAEYLQNRYPDVYREIDAVVGKSVTQELTTRMWRTANPNQLMKSAVSELRRVALAFFDALDDAEDRRALVPRIEDDEAKRLLRDVFLPPKLALTLDRDFDKGKNVTIENFNPIITAVQNRAFGRLKRAVDERESMLVLGPPGCGKTRVGQLAAAYAVHAARPKLARALILVPTKTMVRENHRRWMEWTQHDDEPWDIVAGSADDREYDEALAHGDYHVGICVYEKLASLIYGQRDVLNRVRLIVVDELQNLSHTQRGVNLEALLTILRLTHPRIPIIGLSATLSRESTKTARRWLNIRHVVETHSRPTDLRVHLLDGDARRSRFQAAARTGEDDSIPPEPVDEPPMPHKLGPPPEGWSDSLRGRAGNMRMTLPILQICDLLRDRTVADRRILCFVRDRDRAREAASLIREALEAQDPLPRDRPRHPNPWIYGRYAKDLDLDDAARERRHRELLWTDNHVWRRDVEAGFLSGVAYHTRTLQMNLRRRIEDEFDEGGLVRVLVCTETLAEGVNLAASDVIIADLTQRARDGEEPIFVGQLKNRVGRAGRLGKTDAEGTAHIIIDPRYPKGRLASPATLPILTELDEAWEQWVVQSTPEEGLQSELAHPLTGHENLCGLVLRALAVDQRALSREELVAHIDDVIAHTCWAAWGGRANADELLETLEGYELMEATTPRWATRPDPEGNAVVDTLIDGRLVGPPAEQPDRLQITQLGMSIARSALPIGSSLSIRNLARATQHGMGGQSLMFLAARDPSVSESMKGKWVSWKIPRSPEPPGRDHVIRQIQSYVGLYAHPNVTVRRKLAETRWRRRIPRETGQMDTIAPDPTLVNRNPRPLHPELHKWVTTKGLIEDRDDPDYLQSKALAVAAFRATIAHEWASFQTFQEIKIRLDSITTPRRPNARGQLREPEPAIAYSITDIEQLGERVGYVLAAAGEFLDGQPTAQARLHELALETAGGVPIWLAPLGKLGVEGLGREMLIRLHRTGRPQVDNLERVLDWTGVGLSDEVRVRAKEAYLKSRQRARDIYWQLPSDLENRSVDSVEGRPYSELFRDLVDPPSVHALVTTVEELLRTHAIVAPVALEGNRVVAAIEDEQGGLDLVFYPEDLDRRELRRLGEHGRDAVAVPLKSPTHAVEYELTMPGSAKRAIKPRALLILLHGLRIDHHDEERLDEKLATALRSRLGLAGIGEAQKMLEHVRLPAGVELSDLLELDDLLGEDEDAA